MLFQFLLVLFLSSFYFAARTIYFYWHDRIHKAKSNFRGYALVMALFGLYTVYAENFIPTAIAIFAVVIPMFVLRAEG